MSYGPLAQRVSRSSLQLRMRWSFGQNAEKNTLPQKTGSMNTRGHGPNRTATPRSKPRCPHTPRCPYTTGSVSKPWKRRSPPPRMTTIWETIIHIHMPQLEYHSDGPVLCPMALAHVPWPCPASFGPVLCPTPGSTRQGPHGCAHKPPNGPEGQIGPVPLGPHNGTVRQSRRDGPGTLSAYACICICMHAYACICIILCICICICICVSGLDLDQTLTR